MSQPVSRTGSDRRPDAVREEGARPVEDFSNQHQSESGLDHVEAFTEKKESAMPEKRLVSYLT